MEEILATVTDPYPETWYTFSYPLYNESVFRMGKINLATFVTWCHLLDDVEPESLTVCLINHKH